jgi:hypothetical protein
LTRLSFGGFAVAALLATMGSAAVAQSTGQISGRVVDTSGAVLPGVTITANAGDPRSTSSVKSDGDGRFVITDLRPGVYTLTVGLCGFDTERRRVNVRVGETRIGDVGMRVADLSTITITVSSERGLVDSDLFARSGFFAHLRIEERFDEDSRSDFDCLGDGRVRVRHRVTFLRTLRSPSYRKSVRRVADVFLDKASAVQRGREYVVWLTSRADENAFDTGDDAPMVLPVERGRVDNRRGNCIDVNPPPRKTARVTGCEDTYSVDELFKMFKTGFADRSR